VRKIEMTIKKLMQIISILMMLGSFNVFAADYACEADPIDFNVGDVISSEVFQNIVEKINQNIVGITQSELNTSWSCTTILRPSAGGTLNGYSQNEDGLYTMTQTLTFSEIDSSSSRVIYENNLGQGFGVSPAQDCTIRLVGTRIMFNNYSSGSCSYNAGIFDISKKSNTCMTFTQINDSTTICNKLNTPPDAPVNLIATLNASTNFQAQLIWDAGDTTSTGYNIHRKTTADGTFASIATSTNPNYTDTTVTTNNTYWYRVFATDADGTSVGSNIRQVTYSNTPPSFNIPSTLTISEGTSLVIEIAASDTDGHSLTYSIASQSPGNDASFMTVSAAGVLSFNLAPDYESPADYNTDNIYNITVSISDGFDTVSQNLGVVVLNVSD